jgi:hypothetical protein
MITSINQSIKKELNTISLAGIPILMILYSGAPDYRHVFYLHLICVFFVGVYVVTTNYLSKAYNMKMTIISYLYHMIVLAPVLFLSMPNDIDIYSHIFLMFSIFAIVFVFPEWPYPCSRWYFASLYIIVYVISYVVYLKYETEKRQKEDEDEYNRYIHKLKDDLN